MTPADIAAAFTSGHAGPAIGAGFIVVAWLLGKFRHGIAWTDLWRHVVAQARPLLIPVLVVAGAALMAGVDTVSTVTLAITALLTAGGWTPPKLPPVTLPEEPK